MVIHSFIYLDNTQPVSAILLDVKYKRKTTCLQVAQILGEEKKL